MFEPQYMPVISIKKFTEERRSCQINLSLFFSHFSYYIKFVQIQIIEKTFLQRPLTWEQLQKLISPVFTVWSATWTNGSSYCASLFCVHLCVCICWKAAGAQSSSLYSERELKPFQVETEYWQYVNHRGENKFLREKKPIKRVKNRSTTLDTLFFFLTAFCKLAFSPLLSINLWISLFFISF